MNHCSEFVDTHKDVNVIKVAVILWRFKKNYEGTAVFLQEYYSSVKFDQKNY